MNIGWRALWKGLPPGLVVLVVAASALFGGSLLFGRAVGRGSPSHAGGGGVVTRQVGRLECLPLPPGEPVPTSAVETPTEAATLRAPLAFVENVGQWDSPARFLARSGGVAAHLAPDSITVQVLRSEPRAEGTSGDEEARGRPSTAPIRVRGANLRLAFEGARTEGRLEGRDPLPGRFHFYLGGDSGRWRENVPAFREIACVGLYDGVDLLVRGKDSRLEYDLRLEPWARLDAVTLRVEGAAGPLRLDGDGALVVEAGFGEFRQPMPNTWQEGKGGERFPLECRYRLLGDDRFGFEAPGRDESLGMVVDPSIVWSTFCGGSGDENPYAIAVDANGQSTFAGRTSSTNLPTTPGAFDTTFNGNVDLFVAELNASGTTLLYATYLGGSGSEGEYWLGMALDPATGDALVAGMTTSSNFPTTPGAYDTTFGGGTEDAFLARLSATGALVFSTLLGGSGFDVARRVALDPSGAPVVAGFTYSVDFPVSPGAFDTTGETACGDLFVTRISADGSAILFSTLLGGTGCEDVHGLAVDASGAAVLGGYGPADFPTTPGAFKTTASGTEGFLARLSLAGNGPLDLLYSTFLGPSSVWDLRVDPSGAILFAKSVSAATAFSATPGAFDTTYNGDWDVVVAKLSPSGQGPFDLLYSTFLGGTGFDQPYAIDLDSAGRVTVAGRTSSGNFPTTTGAPGPSSRGGGDAFVAQLFPSGNGAADLLFSSYLGGSGEDIAFAVAADPAGGFVTVGGRTNSGGPPPPKKVKFPVTAGAFDTTYNGGRDAFVTRISLVP